MAKDDRETLPLHIEETIQSIANLHVSHRRSASPLQRMVESLTGFVGRPRFLAALTLLVLAWVVLNAAMSGFDLRPIDPPRFAWLSLAASLTSVFMTVLILTTQRREDELAELREKLTLELAILGEQKSAKIIELLEALRRDHPMMPDRDDEQAQAMASPADPEKVLDALKESAARDPKVPP